MIKLTLLNHASFLIEAGSVRLLCDPWFEGTAFEGGWGLRWETEGVYDLAKTCTHIWVSHFHEDHFHTPTLRKIAALNPEVIVLANDSYNFQMTPAYQRMGFKNVASMRERTTYPLTTNFKVTRYPATGTDNMLLMEIDGKKYLNYNDVVLSPLAKWLLGRRFGEIEIFLSNFNHAGKLLKPRIDRESVIQSLKAAYRNNIRFFRAKHFIPFASFHYYRAPESFSQNDAMIAMNDTADLGERVLPMRLGEVLRYEPNAGLAEIEPGLHVKPADLTQIQRTSSVPLFELEKISLNYMRLINQRFLFLPWLIPSLKIEIYDLKKVVRMDYRRGAIAVAEGAVPHISVHSSVMKMWFTRKYGTDAFTVGAHFDVCPSGRGPLIGHILLGMLWDNKLDLMSLLSMLWRPHGLGFLFNRREEVAGVLLTRNFISDYQRETPQQKSVV